MTDRELKTLKDNLWHAADVLRSGAHLAANKYGQPILGLIFLRYADILFKQHKDEIEAEYTKRLGTRMEKTRKEIAVEKCGFFLPACAYYDYLNNAPDTAEKADLVKKAMEAIERENPKMDGVLPKEVYAQLVPEEEPELLSNIVRIFKDIPENCTVDIFGEIYEYFLGNFALAEGKDGGTFYTPATVVRYMVEVLDPQPGDKKFLDPACGSGGMFVQAARYMHAHNASDAEQMKFRCYGVEKEPDTVKLAKMNLMLNNVRGISRRPTPSTPIPTTLSELSTMLWRIRPSMWMRFPLTESAAMRASTPTACRAIPQNQQRRPPTRKRPFPMPTICGSATLPRH